jgi:hypothetical protein
MSEAHRTPTNVEPLFHPVPHYNSPGDVLHDARLSPTEKRAILSSWASDMYAAESQSALRNIPGIPRPLRLSDILAALRQLDDETDPPPGGATMRLRPPYLFEDALNKKPISLLSGTRKQRPAAGASHSSRWTREQNIRRYRRLLATQLTDIEREFIERRLAEELTGGWTGSRGVLRSSSPRWG